MDDNGVRAFSRLTREQAGQLADMFDEGLLLDVPDLERMRAITGSSFGDDDLLDLAELYTSLLMTKISDAARRDVESVTGLDDDKRSVLSDTAEKMRAAADADKMWENVGIGNIRALGHSHVRRLSVYTEFRPYSKNGSIRCFVPYLVVDGLLHMNGQVESQPIKVQMDADEAQKLLEDLQSNIDALKAQTREMRSKFGDDAVLG